MQWDPCPVPHTVVFFHAHPDDEALLTSGTMAKLAAQGHRVVLVVATAGEAGLSADRAQVRRPARRPATGGARRLGRSGRRAPAGDCSATPIPAWRATQHRPRSTGAPRFVDADREEVVGRVAAILEQERASVVDQL